MNFDASLSLSGLARHRRTSLFTVQGLSLSLIVLLPLNVAAQTHRIALKG